VLRRLLLLGLTLAGLAAPAAAQPPDGGAAAGVTWTAAPAWAGWSRPGRATEIDLRLTARAATRVTLQAQAGAGSVATVFELQPGVPRRLQLPVAAAERIELSLEATGLAPERRELVLSLAETPVLGLALADAASVALDGFHRLPLAAQDLPRHASAYASIDALVLDQPTLAALDERQLAALLAHATACGRIVLVAVDDPVQRLLAGASGCGGRALGAADAAGAAAVALAQLLETDLAPPLSPAALSSLAPPALAGWNRVALVLGVYLAAAVLALVLALPGRWLLAGPAAAALASLALLHTGRPAADVRVWAEGDSAATAAQGLAWQRLPGFVRESARVPIPAALADSVQPCAPGQALRLGFDADAQRFTTAAFETRLFKQVQLCHRFSLPLTRALEVGALVDDRSAVRNTGAQAWPAGMMLQGAQVLALPALAPGGQAVAGPLAPPLPPALAQLARNRLPPGGFGALWPLDLGDGLAASASAPGWLLVSGPLRP
jgi:hypothetical protein